MNIAAHLLCAKPPQKVAQVYIKLLQQRSREENSLSLEQAVQLPHAVLAVIGFPCEITAAQVYSGIYEWPKTLPIYTFPYNSVLFRPLATFLTHMSTVVLQMLEFGQEHDSEAEYFGLLKNYMEMLEVWHGVYTDLEQQDAKSISRRFEEPLALVNFHLLMGLHPLRKAHNADSQRLDVMCDRLYRSAVRGVFYTECHYDIVEGLSSLFAHDFHIFCQYSWDSLDFFYHVLSVMNQKPSFTKIFQLLAEMLEHEEDWSTSEFLLLTNFLIEQKMQEVYFTNLKFGKTKRLLLAVLDFLKLLQSKLPTVDCFSKTFIEALWPLMLNKDVNIATLAAEVYMVIMQRKFNDHLIVRHLMEGYYSLMDTTTLLSTYILTLWPIFPAIANVDEYVELIKLSLTSNTFRSYAAYFLVFVFKQMLQDFAKYVQPLEHLLIMLPSLLEDLNCKVTCGVLLKIYAALNFEELKTNTTKANEIFNSFEKYALETFNTASNCQYPFLFNLFGLLNNCLTLTKNWFKLEEMSIEIYKDFRQLEHSLSNEPFINIKTLRSYNTCLLKISLLLTTGYDIFDNLIDVVERIRERLITKMEIAEFVKRTNSFMDVYAIDILRFSLCKFANSPCQVLTEREQDIIESLAQQLSQYLFEFIKNVEDLPKMPMVRIKTIFCTFIDLHCIFHERCRLTQLEITSQTYHLLVEALILLNFNTKEFCSDGDEQMQTHSLRTQEYQMMMFDKFTQLHSNDYVEIPTNVAWKLCIYYGLPGHKFNIQLAKLLKTIASKQPQMYKHILPVLVYNLHKRKPLINDHAILQAIRAHKKLINTELKLEKPHVIKVHIVLTVLQIVDKSIKVLQLNSNVNRLVALKHLTMLVEDIKWTDKEILELILKQAKDIKANLLTPLEVKTAQSFMDFFEKQKI